MKLPPGSRIRAPFAVSVRGLTVEYGGREILSHVDFQVESGTRTFLTEKMGPAKPPSYARLQSAGRKS